MVAETPKRPPDRLTDSAIGSIPEIETAVFHELATTTLTLVIEPVRSKRPPEYERVCVLCSLFTRNHAQSCDLDFFTRLERLRLIVLFYRFFVALPRGSISSKDFGSSAARDMAINSGDGGHDKPKSHRRLSRGAEHQPPSSAHMYDGRAYDILDAGPSIYFVDLVSVPAAMTGPNPEKTRLSTIIMIITFCFEPFSQLDILLFHFEYNFQFINTRTHALCKRYRR